LPSAPQPDSTDEERQAVTRAMTKIIDAFADEAHKPASIHTN
jgi:hypothetical protein